MYAKVSSKRKNCAMEGNVSATEESAIPSILLTIQTNRRHTTMSCQEKDGNVNPESQKEFYPRCVENVKSLGIVMERQPCLDCHGRKWTLPQ